MPQDLTDDKSTLVQVMAWCHQAASHYLRQCWPRSLSPYGVIRPQGVKGKLCPHNIDKSRILSDQEQVDGYKDQSEYGLSQWEMALHINVISHWLNPCPVWSLAKTRNSQYIPRNTHIIPDFSSILVWLVIYWLCPYPLGLWSNL